MQHQFIKCSTNYINDNPPAHAFNTTNNIIKPPFSINDSLNYFVHGLNTNQFKIVIPNGKPMNIDASNDFNGPEPIVNGINGNHNIHHKIRIEPSKDPDDANINQFVPITNDPASNSVGSKPIIDGNNNKSNIIMS